MIYTVTWNPAIDRVIFLSKFIRNISNRTTKVVDMLGGKGTHVSANLWAMGIKNTALGIVHGDNGRTVLKMLEDLGLSTELFLCKETGNTRMNYLIVENSGDSTLITEPGVTLTAEDESVILRRITRLLHRDDYLVLSGDASNCSDPDMILESIYHMSSRGVKVCLDSSDISLKRSLSENLFLVKPNLDELSFALGREVGENPKEIAKAIEGSRLRFIPFVAVSLGKNGSVVRAGEQYYQVDPAKASAVNTVGCGDCFLAALLCGFENKWDTEKTLRYASACAGACAESQFSYGFDMERALNLMSEIKVRPVFDRFQGKLTQSMLDGVSDA